MTLRHFAAAATMFALAVVIGCAPRDAAPPRGNTPVAPKDDDDDHDHGPGPHGGTIIEFGKWHGEFTVDHKTKEATVYILKGDAKTAAPIPTDGLLLSIKTPQFQVDLKPAPQESDPSGKSSRFAAKHDDFGIEREFEGTLSGVIDGKPYAGDFKEQDPKAAKAAKDKKK